MKMFLWTVCNVKLVKHIILFRHPESTIQKLQNAGLGYFVGRNETKHKLGNQNW